MTAVTAIRKTPLPVFDEISLVNPEKVVTLLVIIQMRRKRETRLFQELKDIRIIKKIITSIA